MDVIEFPKVPVVGQFYSFNDYTYEWDGFKWVSTAELSMDGFIDEKLSLKADKNHNHDDKYLGKTAPAVSALKLSKPVCIMLSGDVEGSVQFDGSDNAVIAIKILDESHEHPIYEIEGLQGALDNKLDASSTAADSNTLEGFTTSQILESASDIAGAQVADALRTAAIETNTQVGVSATVINDNITEAMHNANAYTDSALSSLIGGADGAYDTLKKLEEEISDNDSGMVLLANEIGNKLPSDGMAVNSALLDGVTKDYILNAAYEDATAKVDAVQNSISDSVDSVLDSLVVIAVNVIYTGDDLTELTEVYPSSSKVTTYTYVGGNVTQATSVHRGVTKVTTYTYDDNNRFTGAITV